MTTGAIIGGGGAGASAGVETGSETAGMIEDIEGGAETLEEESVDMGIGARDNASIADDETGVVMVDETDG